MRVIKIPAVTTEHMVELDVPPTIPEINEALFGDKNILIEQVYPIGFHQLLGLVLLVERGRTTGRWPVLNKRASILYGTHIHRQPIMGDAFVVGDAFDVGLGNEDWISVPERITIGHIIDAIQEASDFNREIFG